MKPLAHAISVTALALALAAGTAWAQGRENGGGGGQGGGQGGARTGGGPSGGNGASGGTAVARGGAGPSGGSSGSGGYSAPSGSSGGSSYGGSVGRTSYGGSGGGNVGGRTTSVRSPEYGTPGDRAVPRGARPNPGNPVSGQAVARPSYPGNYPPPGHGGNYHPYYPYNPYYLYGYGAFGLGYLYYDPFWWGYGYPYYGYGYDYSESGPAGALKLKVEPSNAEVWVDGYFMGTVDDFNGAFQHMDLSPGPHRVEVRAEGYEPLVFEVRIDPRDTVTYRGHMQHVVK